MSPKMETDDAHTLLVEAKAQLNGIRNLTALASDEPFQFLTGFELDSMLQPVTERLEAAMKSMEKTSSTPKLAITSS